ncbi:radical SAM protein [Tumebacillus sp. ITR2]|uniref:Radical SAM protein n=1 Tax=Tumebacillus amylolyticus TaxID=2801339 RepID=A0ABS1J553_9BACL|nr:radical SAM protein [Tumebacillus amylolyticus]MBL0385405.1 radical SAM protein [Tumebacillus amylolyticus]
MHLVYADSKGQIYDHSDLLALGRNGEFLTDIYDEELIPLPDGATLVSLPGARALGVDPETGKTIAMPEEFSAVGALLPQGFTRLLLPAYAKKDESETWPLFGYTAVVWKDDNFYVAAESSDDPDKWNPLSAPDDKVEAAVSKITTLYPENRIWQHLTKCALEYGCLTSRNTFLERWEGSLPVSMTCNAGCVGCISEQPDDSPFPSPQVRMDFKPTVEEMVQLMVHHLNTAGEDSIISFGQGCEGEPSTRGVDIAEAIRRVRAETHRGFININTNAGLTDMIKLITDAGLDLMRVSTISALDDHYNAYYRPRLYGVENVGRSLKYAADKGVYTSINYLIFPGVTDREEEIEAMVDFVNENNVRLIQMRNLNIDPEWYLNHIPKARGELLGMKTMLEIFRQECPNTVIGSFTHVPPEQLRRNRA